MLEDCPSARFQPYAGERYKEGIPLLTIRRLPAGHFAMGADVGCDAVFPD